MSPVFYAVSAGFSGLAFALTLWQWIAARRFPLDQSSFDADFAPAVTVFKPVKGCDPETINCMESWLQQSYPGPVQFLFGVADPRDPACDAITALIARYPGQEGSLVICPEKKGANGKVSTLIQLAEHAQHGLWLVSDADVKVSPQFLHENVEWFKNQAVGLVNSLYCLANPQNLAMRLEAVAVNADFWSQVLQGRTLQRLDFALGAVMLVRREALEGIGGFESLKDYLADDFQLGHQISANGWLIELGRGVAQCFEPPMTFPQVLKHQLRWARTIRVCRPAGYFFSILANTTFWALLWVFVAAWTGLNTGVTCLAAFCICLVRSLVAIDLQFQLTRSRAAAPYFWIVPFKDLVQFLIWVLAFAGNTIQWRGSNYRVERGGKLVPLPDQGSRRAR